jgi:hypothetical protein
MVGDTGRRHEPQRAVLFHQARHGGRHAGQIEFAADEPCELGGRLVDDGDDEGAQGWRPAHGMRKSLVAHKAPLAASATRCKAKWSVPHRVRRKGMPPPFGAWHGVEQMPGDDGQLGQDVRQRWQRRPEVQPDDGPRQHLRALDDSDIASPRRAEDRIARGGQRERHIVRRGGHAVVPGERRVEDKRGCPVIVIPPPLGGEVRDRLQGAVQANEGHEERVPLHLPRERMHRDQWIARLEIGP